MNSTILLKSWTMGFMVLMLSLSGAASLPDWNSFDLQTNYICDTAGVFLSNNKKVLNLRAEKQVILSAQTSDNQNLVIGNFEYMIWPRLDWKKQSKFITILGKTKEGLQEIKNIEMGSLGTETTVIELPVTDHIGNRTVSCQVSITLTKK